MNSSFAIVLCAIVLLFSGFSLCGAQEDEQNENEIALLEAAKNGKEKIVEELLLRNGPNIIDKFKLTPLHWAARYGYEKIVDILLKSGANANAENNNKDTPFHWAAGYGHEKVVELLHKSGANANAENNNKATPLLLAAEFGREKVVELLLRNDTNHHDISETLHCRDNFQNTALHWAAWNGHANVAELLIKNDANLTLFEDKNNEIPLHIAAKRGHENVVQLLLETRENVNARSKDRILNGAHAYASSFRLRIDRTPLHFAAENGNEKVVEFLLKFGAKIDAENLFKEKPILLAAQNGHANVVGILLANGADVNSEDEERLTPLHWGAWNGHGNVVDILLNSGSNIEAEDINAVRPIHKAIELEYEEILLKLVRHGASKLAKTNFGQMPMDIALLKDNEALIRILNDAKRPAIEACEMYQNYTKGRSPAESNEFPWMAALGYTNELTSEVNFNCSGTIISDHFVLTSAHCADPSNAPDVVRLRNITLLDTDEDENVTNYKIEKIIRHPDYSNLTKKNDIGLVQLSEKINFTEFLSPACLQTDLHDEHLDVKLIETYWEQTSVEGNKSTVLLKGQLKTVPWEECSDKYVDHNLVANVPYLQDGISKSQYCAFDPERRNDSCHGYSSGSPLQIFNGSNGEIATVVGIASFSIDCGSQLPGIYTRVAYYLDWIESIVWPVRDKHAKQVERMEARKKLLQSLIG